MGKHLLAIRVDQRMYRDSLTFQLDDAAFHALVGKRALPPHIYAYHYSSNRQWEQVLKLPEYTSPTYRSVLTEVEIAFSAHGACRRCDRIPADGLWQGKLYREDLHRLFPYKGYICEQCAQQMEEETGEKGIWI